MGRWLRICRTDTRILVLDPIDGSLFLGGELFGLDLVSPIPHGILTLPFTGDFRASEQRAAGPASGGVSGHA